MNLKETNVAVNIRDNNVHVVRGIIKNDTGNQFNLKLIDGTEAFDFTGYGSIVMNLLKPDGTFIVDGTGQRLTAEDVDVLEDATGQELDEVLELVNDNEHLQIVDAKTGRLSIKLDYEQATLLTGMHFITISLYAATETDTTRADSDVVKVTTARINYYVEDNIDNTDDEEIMSRSEFPILDQMLAKCTDVYYNEYNPMGRVAMETERRAAEVARAAAEAARVAAETARADECAGIIAQARAYLEDAQDILELMAKIIHGEIHDYDEYAPVVIRSEMAEAIAEAMAQLETIDGTTTVLKMNRGLESAMDIAAGELYFATDTGKLYIGAGSGIAICINESEHIMSSTPPSDTSKIWIDTTNNALKFYDSDEEAWVGTATATFG